MVKIIFVGNFLYSCMSYLHVQQSLAVFAFVEQAVLLKYSFLTDNYMRVYIQTINKIPSSKNPRKILMLACCFAQELSWWRSTRTKSCQSMGRTPSGPIEARRWATLTRTSLLWPRRHTPNWSESLGTRPSSCPASPALERLSLPNTRCATLPLLAEPPARRRLRRKSSLPTPSWRLVKFYFAPLKI
jgi:hypothetical protein